MQFSQKTVLGLFDSSQKSFVIPVYQRAYSWDKSEWETLISDLKEQINGKNNYFFGNLLLETIKKDVQYEIIDGQQRLTTLMIFIRSLLNVLKERKKTDKTIKINISSKETIYLQNGGNIKLRPVEYDRACFDTLIVKGKDKFTTSTPSQVKIKSAKAFFIKELDIISTPDLIKILDKIESTELTCIELKGKKDSALMFELQNNRGKDLTNMEKLKSYFMYQMYVYSNPEQTEANIEHISNIFKSIYLVINDLKTLNEDSVLLYHCNTYVKGFYYRTLDDIKEVFKDQPNKVEWISLFVEELYTTFSNMKKLEINKDQHLANLKYLSIPAFAYPFLIKGYKFFDEGSPELSKLFHIIEIVVFRYRLINSRADINSRLNDVLSNFNGNLDDLITRLKTKLYDYWNDHEIKWKLNSWMYQNKLVNYVLWRYENKLQKVGYTVGRINIENEQIEHISPQTPSISQIETGYDVDENNNYDEDFQNNYLHKIGNLMLISGSHNSSIGNKPFADKLKSYNENPLLKQQSEIKNFLDNEIPKWNKAAINKRQNSIVEDFAIKEWNFDNFKISL